MKIYNISILVEPKQFQDDGEIMEEILAQFEQQGQEKIIQQVSASIPHEVIKRAAVMPFPPCLTEGTNRMAFEISLPTKKDLGRRWFLKRLEGDMHKTFQLVATSDVAVIHIELA